jgi:hypothetical protein
VAHVPGIKAADSQLQARDYVEGELAGDAAEGRDQERRNGMDGAWGEEARRPPPPPRRGRLAGAATGGGEGTPPVPQRRCSRDAAATGDVSKAEGSTATVARTASDPEELGQEGLARRRSSRRRGGRWERGREEVAVAVAGAGNPVHGRTDGVARS